MKYLHLVIIILISGFMLSGHAASPKKSGYLSDYDRLVEGEYLEAYWVDMTRIEKATRRAFSWEKYQLVG